MSVWNWVVAHWSIIAEVLTVLVAAIVVYFKGKTNEVAGQIIAFIVALAKTELKDVPDSAVFNVALYFYKEYLPAIVRALVTDMTFATWVVEKVWHGFLNLYAADKAFVLKVMA